MMHITLLGWSVLLLLTLPPRPIHPHPLLDAPDILNTLADPFTSALTGGMKRTASHTDDEDEEALVSEKKKIKKVTSKNPLNAVVGGIGGTLKKGKKQVDKAGFGGITETALRAAKASLKPVQGVTALASGGLGGKRTNPKALAKDRVFGTGHRISETIPLGNEVMEITNNVLDVASRHGKTLSSTAGKLSGAGVTAATKVALDTVGKKIPMAKVVSGRISGAAGGVTEALVENTAGEVFSRASGKDPKKSIIPIPTDAGDVAELTTGFLGKNIPDVISKGVEGAKKDGKVDVGGLVQDVGANAGQAAMEEGMFQGDSALQGLTKTKKKSKAVNTKKGSN